MPLLALGGFIDTVIHARIHGRGISRGIWPPERKLGGPAKHRMTQNHDVYKCFAVISLNHLGQRYQERYYVTGL